MFLSSFSHVVGGANAHAMVAVWISGTTGRSLVFFLGLEVRTPGLSVHLPSEPFVTVFGNICLSARLPPNRIG